VATGTFTSGPATLSFEAWHGLVGCDVPGEDGAVATYAWRQSDDRLALTAIDDACAERLTLLTSRPLGSLDACTTESLETFDPFAAAAGTPSAEPTPASGVAAQEGYGEGADVEGEIDSLLRTANGCWATADPDSFMGLHSQGLRGQIAMMGPPEDFTRELREFMEAPLTLERISAVTLDDPDHAWAYVEVNLGDQPNPQRMNFVQEDGVWRLDSFFLLGPPTPSGPIRLSP
jgi:hypothetical protein